MQSHVCDCEERIEGIDAERLAEAFGVHAAECPKFQAMFRENGGDADDPDALAAFAHAAMLEALEAEQTEEADDLERRRVQALEKIGDGLSALAEALKNLRLPAVTLKAPPRKPVQIEFIRKGGSGAITAAKMQEE